MEDLSHVSNQKQKILKKKMNEMPNAKITSSARGVTKFCNYVWVLTGKLSKTI